MSEQGLMRERFAGCEDVTFSFKERVFARMAKTDPDYENMRALLRREFDRVESRPARMVESDESTDDSNESLDESERPDEPAIKELLFGGMNQTSPGYEPYLRAVLRHEEPRPESTDDSDESRDESERPDEPANSPTTSRRRTTTRGAAAGRGTSTRRGTAASRKTPYTCTKCGMKFDDKNAKDLHKLEHRRDKVPEKRRLYCNYPGCKFFTGTKSHLEYHVKTHKSEKDFICKICGYSCIVSSMLISHMASHTDERPYKCEPCGYATKYRSALNTHMKEKHGIIRVRSKTGTRGGTRINRQDTDVDTVDRNFANDGVRPNSSHAPYGQHFPSPQHSSPSTSSAALFSPPTPSPFTLGIRAPLPAHYNTTIPSFLPFLQSPLTPTSPSISQEMLASLFPLVFPHFTPLPAHTKPLEPPSCLNSILPSPPLAHTNPIPKHQGLDWILLQLPPSIPPDLALNDKLQVIQRIDHIVEKLKSDINSLIQEQRHESD